MSETIQTIEAHKTSDGQIFEDRNKARQHQAKIDLKSGIMDLFKNHGGTVVDFVTDAIFDLDDTQKMELEKLLQNFCMTKACTS